MARPPPISRPIRLRYADVGRPAPTAISPVDGQSVSPDAALGNELQSVLLTTLPAALVTILNPCPDALQQTVPERGQQLNLSWHQFVWEVTFHDD